MKLILIFITSTLIFSEIAKATIPSLIDIRRTYCKGNTSDIKNWANQIKYEDPNYIPANILTGRLNQDFFSEKFANYKIEKLSDKDRLIFIEYLFSKRSLDLVLINKLLEFNSNDIITQGYKLYYEGLTHIFFINKNTGIDLIQKALVKLPTVDSFLLADYFAFLQDLPDNKNNLEFGLKLVEKVPSNDPDKKLLDLYKKILTQPNNPKDNELDYYNEIESIYQICPNDLYYRTYYSFALFTVFRIEEAKKHLLDLSNRKYYPTEVDYLLTLIFYSLNDPDQAQIFFNKAKKTINYLPEKDQKILLTYETKEASQTKFNYRSLYLIVAQVILILAILNYFRKRFKKVVTKD